MKHYIRKMCISVILFWLACFFLIQDWGVNNKPPIPSLFFMLSGVIVFFDAWRQYRGNKK